MRQLPSDLLSKINQNMQTIGNNANPKMEVVVSRAKNAVYDSSYWAVETIREISGLGDVSVAPRRLKTYGRPDRIYEVHIRDGQIYTSIREYPDKLREGFKTQFSLGSGSSVGLAFNGEWKRYRKFYRLVTEDKPWITWVDTNGVLWVQRWDDLSTKFQLSTNVLKVKMIRAWKNLVILHQDQGIVVSYIKTNGKVYYRNYCIQEDGSESWEYEKELTRFTGTAVNVNLFITNDYRMGFIIEDNLGKIHWLVTNRNWGGMASPVENINTGIKEINMEVIPIKYHESYLDIEYISTGANINRLYVCPANITPEIVNIERLTFVDKKTIQVVFNYILECENNTLKESLILTNTVGYRYIIDTITEQDNILTIKTLEEMPTSQNIILSYNDIDSYNIAFRISSTCLYRYDNVIDLVIKGLPPTGYFAENLQIGITPTFVPTKVYYKDLYSGIENISTGIVNPTIVVTKVGSNPL